MLEKQAFLAGPAMWLGTVTAWQPEQWGWLLCTIIGAVANAYVLVMVKRAEIERKQREKTDEAD